MVISFMYPLERSGYFDMECFVSGRDGLVATTLNNLGLLLKSVGRPEGAMKYYNEALTIRRC
jgi:hypothetical protein